MIIGYVRVSTDEQAGGLSPARQEEQIRLYCRLHYPDRPAPTILRDEGVSGFRRDNRRAFQLMVRLCQEGKVTAVVATDMSRFSRSVRDTFWFVEDVLAKQETALVCITQHIDTSSAMGKAMLGLIAVFAQLYRDEASEKTRRGLAHKRSRGEKTGGHAPYGFGVLDQGGLKILVPDPDEQAVLALMHTMRAAGASYHSIAAHLQARAIPTKSGRSWWFGRTVSKILSASAKRRGQ